MFALDSISKSVAGVPVITGVDLATRAGRTTVLIGPSGSGKTTLLRLMLGLTLPDAGTVRFAGRPVEPENARLLRRHFGYVVQGGGLFPHLSARADAGLMARREGWSTARIADRLVELQELVWLDADVWDRHPGALSGGQRQRVALVRALMRDPDVLLLDEPLGSLDPLVRFDLQNDLGAIFEAVGKTVVLVTHDMNEAASLGDDIVLLRDGAVVCRGTFSDLRASEDPFVQRFIRAQCGAVA